MFPFNRNSRKEPVYHQRIDILPIALRKGIFFGILLAAGMMTICSPVFALASSAPGGGFARFNEGIPVYWPYHVLLISVGFILLAAGFITVRFRKTGSWYRIHMILEAGGAACVIAGLFVAVYMVTLSDVPHLRNIHEITGVATVTLIVITVVVGYLIRRVQKSKNIIRPSHRWLGRLSIALVVINIVLGLLVLSLVLNR